MPSGHLTPETPQVGTYQKRKPPERRNSAPLKYRPEHPFRIYHAIDAPGQPHGAHWLVDAAACGSGHTRHRHRHLCL